MAGIYVTVMTRAKRVGTRIVFLPVDSTHLPPALHVYAQYSAVQCAVHVQNSVVVMRIGISTMAELRSASAVQYVAKIMLMFLVLASKSSAIKISFANQQHGSTEPPVHINLHLHVDGNKVVAAPNQLHVNHQQLQCAPPKNRPRAPGIEIDATPIAAHELQKWLSDFEKVSVEGAEGVRHTILVASHQGVALDGISLLPGCVEGRKYYGIGV